MDRAAMLECIEELESRGHLTQKEMKQMVGLLRYLVDTTDKLAAKTEAVDSSRVSFDDNDLRELASKLSEFEKEGSEIEELLDKAEIKMGEDVLVECESGVRRGDFTTTEGIKEDEEEEKDE